MVILSVIKIYISEKKYKEVFRYITEEKKWICLHQLFWIRHKIPNMNYPVSEWVRIIEVWKHRGPLRLDYPFNFVWTTPQL